MTTDMTSEPLRCPKCGRDVETLHCGHCGRQLDSWQADLYGAAVRQIARLGGSRTDAGQARGNAGESLTGERISGESLGDDDEPREIGGDIDDQGDRNPCVCGTSQPMHRPIRPTKQLEALLCRYDVSLRNTHSTVEHVTYRTKVNCSPITFAVFEAAVKSAYLSSVLTEYWDKSYEYYYQALAHKNSFVLPKPLFLPKAVREQRSKQAASDYYYFANLIARAGLYRCLLE